MPAAGTEVPLWILGSSHFGAMLAAELGLPYAFASHFAPDLLLPALRALSQPLQAVGAARPAVRDGRRSTSIAARDRRRGAGASRPRSRCRLPTSSAAHAASASRRSTTSRPTGRRRRRRRRCACWPARSSARRQTVRAGHRCACRRDRGGRADDRVRRLRAPARLRSVELIAEGHGSGCAAARHRAGANVLARLSTFSGQRLGRYGGFGRARRVPGLTRRRAPPPGPADAANRGQDSAAPGAPRRLDREPPMRLSVTTFAAALSALLALHGAGTPLGARVQVPRQPVSPALRRFAASSLTNPVACCPA